MVTLHKATLPVVALVVSSWCLISCSRAPEGPIKQVEVAIKNDGVYELDGKEVPAADLRKELHALKASPNKIQIHLLGAPDTQQGIAFLKIADEEGITRVGFITEPTGKEVTEKKAHEP